LGRRQCIDVTTPGATGRRRAGIHIHDGTTLTPADITLIDNIPCTTLARTLLDIAEDGTRREVERALDAAEQQRLLDLRAIDDVLERASGRRGAKLLRAVLDEHNVGSTPTRNDLEEAFLAIARAAELPPGAVNVWIPFPDGGGAEADFLYGDQHLIVETDGRDTHAVRKAFGSDRRRDARLMLLGWRVVRFTWQQVMRAGLRRHDAARPAQPSLLSRAAARRAASVHDRLDALLLEAVLRRRALERRGVERRVEVLDRAADRADEVVVRVHARIEQRRAGALHAAHHAELLEQLERGVDRRQRDVRQAVGDGLQQLVGRHVAVELAQRAVQHHALRGNTHTAVAKSGGEFVVHAVHLRAS
jgi:hypothetical protein